MKGTIISIAIAALLIVGAVVYSKSGGGQAENYLPANNVTVVDGKQIIEISARGGYSPRRSVAKSGMPTIIRFKTSGTFDCSSSVRIPSLNITKFLPQTGVTDIDLGSPQSTLLRGSCGMGMYPFEVDFQS